MNLPTFNAGEPVSAAKLRALAEALSAIADTIERPADGAVIGSGGGAGGGPATFAGVRGAARAAMLWQGARWGPGSIVEEVIITARSPDQDTAAASTVTYTVRSVRHGWIETGVAPEYGSPCSRVVGEDLVIRLAKIGDRGWWRLERDADGDLVGRLELHAETIVAADCPTGEGGGGGD